MKNNKLKFSILVCTLILSSLFLFGCSNKTEEEEIVNPIEVYISITYPKDAKIDSIKDDELKIEEGSSVSDALQLYCNINEISTTMDTTSGDVTGIDSVTNGDFASDDSGKKVNPQWQFKINGEISSQAPSEAILEAGDKVEWFYK